MRKLLLRYNLLIVLILVVLLPGAIFVLVNMFGEKTVLKFMRSGYGLSSVTMNEYKKPQYNLKSFSTHEIQNYLEEQLNNNLPMRSTFVRSINQLYYDIFQKAYAHNGNIIIGKDNQLFEKLYIDIYCGNNKFDNQEIDEWVQTIKFINNYYVQNGKVFIYVISPSKAEYYSEYIPNRFHCKKASGSSNYINKLATKLKDNEIKFINGHDMMKVSTKQYATKMFPLGGIHWNNLGATILTNAIISSINKSKDLKLPELKFDLTQTFDPKGMDKDLAALLNIYKLKKQYSVPLLDYKENINANFPLKVVLIGSSFTSQIYSILVENKVFSSLTRFYYFRLSKDIYQNGNTLKLNTVNVSNKEDIKDIYTADVVILEENIAASMSNHAKLLYETLKSKS